MTTPDWPTLYNQALKAFGDTPSPTLEQHLIDAHTQNPDAVATAIRKIINAHKTGRINSPWGALKTEVQNQLNKPAQPTNTHTHLRNAEQHIRNAGIHYDRFSELHDEHFGTRGNLRHQPQLASKLEALWNELRPVGEQLEHDELARAEHWKTTRPGILKPLDPTTVKQPP